MSISHTTWNILEECYGKDIKNRIYSGSISDGELYEICYLMDADYRYVLMQRDDYILSNSDPVRDPRIEEGKTDKKKENNNDARKNGGIPDMAPAEKEKSVKKSSRRNMNREAWRKKDREDNKIIRERFDKLFAASGYTFDLFRKFLGIALASENQMFEHKTFEKGVTTTIAWMLETTPEFLEGRTNDMHANAENVVRPILSSQDFMIDSAAIKSCGEKIKNNLNQIRECLYINDDFVTWLTTGDRLVTKDFAEKIAQAAGLHITAIRSFKKKYESEPSIVGIAARLSDNEKPDEKESGNRLEEEKQAKVSHETEKAVKAKANEEEKKRDQPEELLKNSPNNESEGKENSPSEKDLFKLINSLTDDKLELIGKYVQSVKELRNLEKQFQ